MNHGDAASWSVWPAPAKLNLFLRIVGQREDGFHLLQTVFRLLDWGDDVRIRVRADGRITRAHGAEGVPAEQDLTVRAAQLLKQHTRTSQGADLDLVKRIPVGGGLGGGSSDAATVLVALNRLWDTRLERSELAQLGLSLGADVPVFVRGQSAWAEGVGERLQPLELPAASYVVLDPGVQVSTAAFFRNRQLTRNAAPATISSFVDGDVTDNAFTPLARTQHAPIAAALDWLGQFGLARLSGSGACVFLECETRNQCERIAARCPDRFKAFVADGVTISPLRSKVESSNGA